MDGTLMFLSAAGERVNDRVEEDALYFNEQLVFWLAIWPHQLQFNQN